MKFSVLTKEEFNNFVNKEITNNFFQSVAMYERLQAKNIECYLVGIKEQNRVVAATLVEATSTFMGKKVFEAMKGFILNYDNYELIETFTKEILEFIKSKGGFKLIIDPYIPYISRDIDGNEILGEVDNRGKREYLEKIGYKYLGEKVQVKWVFVLDINKMSSEELLANFKSNTRNLINKTLNQYNLIVRELTYDELPLFKKITSETCERKDFNDRSLEYYQEMVKYFKKDIKVLIAELNCDICLKKLKTEIEDLKSRITKLGDKSVGKIKEMQISIDSLEEKINVVTNLKKEKGNIIPLSAAMFMLYGNEIIYLFSGSYQEYMKFYGQYRLQWEMIKYAASNNYQRYNFYGIKNFKDPHNKDYGIYEFKKGFNGHIEELLGVFEIGVGFSYKIFNILKKIKNIFKKSNS